MDNTSGNVLGGDAASAAESFYGSAVTSQRSKTEVGSLLRPMMSSARVRFGRKNIQLLQEEAEEPLYPERFPVNSTHRGGTLETQPNTTSEPNNDYGDDEDSATMVSCHKSLKSGGHI